MEMTEKYNLQAFDVWCKTFEVLAGWFRYAGKSFARYPYLLKQRKSMNTDCELDKEEPRDSIILSILSRRGRIQEAYYIIAINFVSRNGSIKSFLYNFFILI